MNWHQAVWYLSIISMLTASGTLLVGAIHLNKRLRRLSIIPAIITFVLSLLLVLEAV